MKDLDLTKLTDEELSFVNDGLIYLLDKLRETFSQFKYAYEEEDKEGFGSIEKTDGYKSVDKSLYEIAKDIESIEREFHRRRSQ